MAVVAVMMDAALLIFCPSMWCLFFYRNWRTAEFLDRYEGMILRPLSLSIDLLALHYFLHRYWWAAGIAICWGLLIGGVAANTLGPERSLNDLLHPSQPITASTKKELAMLSSRDAYRLGMAQVKLSIFSFIPELILFLHHGLKWYMALLMSVATSIIIGPILTLVCLLTAGLLPSKQRVFGHKR